MREYFIVKGQESRFVRSKGENVGSRGINKGVKYPYKMIRSFSFCCNASVRCFRTHLFDHIPFVPPSLAS